MSLILQYKGYRAEVKVDADETTFYGLVEDLRDVISFEADNLEELKRAFHDSVDDYLAFCAERGQDPEKPCNGKILVRISPLLHKDLAIVAKKARTSVNQFITNAIKDKIAKTETQSDSHASVFYATPELMNLGFMYSSAPILCSNEVASTTARQTILTLPAQKQRFSLKKEKANA